jgi:hypothetical protein
VTAFYGSVVHQVASHNDSKVVQKVNMSIEEAITRSSQSPLGNVTLLRLQLRPHQQLNTSGADGWGATSATPSVQQLLHPWQQVPEWPAPHEDPDSLVTAMEADEGKHSLSQLTVCTVDWATEHSVTVVMDHDLATLGSCSQGG